jgi:hypothetical protein
MFGRNKSSERGDRFTCPRRFESYQEFNNDRDTWENRTQFADGIKALHCSYCGSLNDTQLLDLLEAGKVAVSGTDKTYKWYIHENSTPQQRIEFTNQWPLAQREMMSVNAGRAVTKFYTLHMKPENIVRWVTFYRADMKKDALTMQVYLYRPPAWIDTTRQTLLDYFDSELPAAPNKEEEGTP